jgi:mitogen-activated protein kinase organizer 1
MDMTNGKLLNDFTGHTNAEYRCRACFGHGEATVVCGDEKGTVWAWDLLDVRLCFYFLASCVDFCKAKPLQPNPPPKVHNKVITWTEHHPIEKGEMFTASADGTVKVWRQAETEQPT